MEREDSAAIMQTKLNLTGAIASGLAVYDPKFVEQAYKDYETYLRLALPYMDKKDKVNKEVTKETAEGWKKMLEERKKQFANLTTKEETK